MPVKFFTSKSGPFSYDWLPRRPFWQTFGKPGRDEYIAARKLFKKQRYEASAQRHQAAQARFPNNPHIALQAAVYARFGLIGYEDTLQYLSRFVSQHENDYERFRIMCALAELIWERRGPTDFACNLAKEIADSPFAGARRMLRFAAALEQAGLCDEAVSIADRAYSLDSYTAKQTGHLRLLLALRKNGRHWPVHSDSAARIGCHLDASAEAFQQIVSASSGDFALVANGPSLVGTGKGAEIDTHEVVVRYNNFLFGESSFQDRGKKTDVWFRHHTAKYVPISPLPGLRLVVVLGHGVDTRFSDGVQCLENLFLLGVPIQTIPSEVYVNLFTQLDAAPSAGLIAAAWASENTLHAIQTSQLYGYDLSINTRLKSHYYYETSELSQLPSRHNWSKENALLKEICERL
ncbi:hypothetical protein V1T76_28720 [Roseibium sp. FZY0029]|uniref:hypothetical protein n=1 Tax=Roseibium sp. FZY0029 TaxID=3116647 RepID=UPI002EB41C91|nr:hypothetical protein [Roseibium sp. FZY0029]